MTTPEREPDLLLVYTSGNYYDALAHHRNFRQWALDNTLCYRADLSATLHTPRFKGQKPPREMTDSNGWMEKTRQDGWTVTVDFFTGAPEVTAELRALAPPDKAAWRDAEPEPTLRDFLPLEQAILKALSAEPSDFNEFCRGLKGSCPAPRDVKAWSALFSHLDRLRSLSLVHVEYAEPDTGTNLPKIGTIRLTAKGAELVRAHLDSARGLLAGL